MRFLTKEELNDRAIRSTDPIEQAIIERIKHHMDAGEIVTIDEEDRIQLHLKPEVYT